MSKASAKKAKKNAAARGKKPGAYDQLRAAGKPMKATKKK